MTADETRHDPVMVNEVLEALALKPGFTVVDGTLGLGGHTLELIKAVEPDGTIMGFDWDKDMLAIASERIGQTNKVNIQLYNLDFKRIPDEVGEVNGVLLDLGLNSAQVDDPTRGLSFQQEGPLDMRMDRTHNEPASAVLNRMSPVQIEQMLKDLGDERWARAIAKKIVERRKEAPLKTTEDLKQCVLAAIPTGARDKRIHPATRTFQAVRIYVNGEFDGLSEAIKRIAHCLVLEGRLAILSYHSGEDRIVKRAFRDLLDQGFEELYRKPLTPSEMEISRNPRSRSAKLRAIKRSVMEGATN
jgi:16S rRNA (cytosine1402-N4)-methyltransferase